MMEERQMPIEGGYLWTVRIGPPILSRSINDCAICASACSERCPAGACRRCSEIDRTASATLLMPDNWVEADNPDISIGRSGQPMHVHYPVLSRRLDRRVARPPVRPSACCPTMPSPLA